LKEKIFSESPKSIKIGAFAITGKIFLAYYPSMPKCRNSATLASSCSALYFSYANLLIVAGLVDFSLLLRVRAFQSDRTTGSKYFPFPHI